MLTIRRAGERGFANHGWLQARHTFSFADYYNPDWMGFRSLRVLNDDVIAGGGGFGTHPHRDMEIITYVLRGALEHKDSMGNGRVIRPGEVQYMAAGTGVSHSEFNHSPTEPVRLLQTWIQPDRKGVTPRYGEKSFASAATGRLHLVASKAGRDGSIEIHRDADVFVVKFAGGETVAHAIRPGRHAWIQVAEGDIEVNGQELHTGDGAAASDESELKLTAKHSANVLLFDLD